MRRKGGLAILLALCHSAMGFAAPQPSDTLTVTMRAILTAKGHFSDGTSRADDKITLNLTETSVYRLSSMQTSQLLSFQHDLSVEGSGQLVLGADLPTPRWTYAPDNRDPNPHSSVRLDRDAIHGYLSLRDFSDDAKMICELPNEGLTSSYPIAPVLAGKTFSDYAVRHPVGGNHLNVMLPFAFPPNAGARKASGELSHEFTEQSGAAGTGKLIVNFTVTLGPPALPEEEESPGLKAVPAVTSTVARGETVILDGTKSKGDVRDYTWTFRSRGAGAGNDPPNEKARKKGASSSVVLLDSMDVTLTVTDGKKTDSKSVTVTVTPRSYFRTEFEHVSEEGILPDSTSPSCTWTGTDSHGQKTYYGEWVGGENVCAIDPPEAGSSEAPHILHPKLEGAGPDDLYVLGEVKDPQGPWDSFSYFKEWKVEVSRQTRLNQFLDENGPRFPGMRQNFYDANLAQHIDVSGYLAAVRKHEYQHSEMMAEALRECDPAKESEKAWGRNPQKLRDEAGKRIREAGKILHDRAKDPLAQLWKGSVAVPQRGILEWRTFEVTVGGPGYGSF